MDELKFEKSIKNAKWFAVGLLVLALIGFIFQIMAVMASTSSATLFAILLRSVQISLIIATIKGCNDKKIYGPVCGIIVSILLIMAMDIVDIILGILYLIDCIKLVTYMKK